MATIKEILSTNHTYLDDAPEITGDLDPAEAPLFLQQALEAVKELEQENNEEWDDDEEGESLFTLHTTENGFAVGSHDEGCPFNPSGCEFYFTASGEYLGSAES